jgi:hypothetical protein
MSQQPFDQGIPLLTEVLLGPDVPERRPSRPLPAAVEEAPALPPGVVQPDWDAIEARLTQRILHRCRARSTTCWKSASPTCCRRPCKMP